MSSRDSLFMIYPPKYPPIAATTKNIIPSTNCVSHIHFTYDSTLSISLNLYRDGTIRTLKTPAITPPMVDFATIPDTNPPIKIMNMPRTPASGMYVKISKR